MFGSRGASKSWWSGLGGIMGGMAHDEARFEYETARRLADRHAEDPEVEKRMIDRAWPTGRLDYNGNDVWEVRTNGFHVGFIRIVDGEITEII
jgi:hypothetical protein